MATAKGKVKGSYDFILAIDCETTGLCLNHENPVYNPKTEERHQTVSWGVIVADAQTLKPIEQLYTEIKWNTSSKKQRKENPKFGIYAETIHGLTYDYLQKNGITEDIAVEQIGSLIVKYWGPKVSIRTLGHNVHLFDLPFLRDLFSRQGIELAFGNRHVDTSSTGFVNLTTFTSDELFDKMGFEPRKDHNSLQDITQTLESARRMRIIFQKAWNE